MNAQISSIEIQLIKSSLATKTDEEIAGLIEIDVEDVIEYINELTEGGAADRNAEVLKQREEQDRPKIKKKLIQEEQVVRKEKLERRNKERQDRLNTAEKVKVERGKRNDRQKFKTRKLELDKMISVRVDRKTHILVPPGTDIEKAKAQYFKNLKR